MSRSRAFQVSGPKRPLEKVEREIAEPGPGQVRVRVEACGVCHSDSLTVEGHWPGISYPRVPGHEIAGTIDALGRDVPGWAVGDRVGIGWHGGHCGYCESCRRGDFVTCRIAAQVPGIAYDGGYSDFLIAPAVALARIPASLSAIEAAPLLCAGITTYISLRNSGARAGDLVAVLGVGGLSRSRPARTRKRCRASSARITRSTANPRIPPRSSPGSAGRRSSWRRSRADRPWPPSSEASASAGNC